MKADILKPLLFVGFFLFFCTESLAQEKKCVDTASTGIQLNASFVDVVEVLNANENERPLPFVGEKMTTGADQKTVLTYSVPTMQKLRY